MIRPERVRLGPFDETGPNRLPGMVDRLVYVGSSTQVIVRLPTGATIQALYQNQGAPPTFEQGTPVSVFLPADALRVLAGGPSDKPPALLHPAAEHG